MCRLTELPSKISMIPYYNCRGPSRILWFLIGAATTHWLIKRKDCDSRVFGHCRRLQYQTPPPNSSVPDGAPSNGAASVPNPWSVTARDIPRTINNIPPSHWGSEQQQSWYQEKEHLADITRKVTDAVWSCLCLYLPKFPLLMTFQMADLTEATLESVLSAAEALKAVRCFIRASL
jgi:hypothetical protein